MHDQRTLTEGGGSVKRFQFGLRLIFLLVALCAVFFAWIGVKRNMERATFRRAIKNLEEARNFPADSESERKQYVREVDAEIARYRKLLGEEK